jgi:hypothetical protein
MRQRHISHYQQLGITIVSALSFLGCQGHEIYEESWALMMQRHISPYQQLGQLLSQTCALCPGRVAEVVISMRKAAPHFPLSAARQTTFPDLRPVVLGCQDGEKIYKESWTLMLQRHISPYQQLNQLLSQTCALCSGWSRW